MRFTDQVAVISGGTGGIGTAIARRLLDEGSHAVVVTGRDERRGTAAARALGAGAHFRAQDVTDEKGWSVLLAEVVERFGRLDVLVNNAGTASDGTPQDIGSISLQSWHRLFATNLDGVFLGCRAAVEVMAAAGGGSIVNVSSTAALMSTPRFVAYGAAKAAVTQLTKSVAVHCARLGNGVRCNSVHPSLIGTDLGDDILRMFDDDVEQARSTYLTRVPMGQLGTPTDVAAAVAYLASTDAAYVTGAQIVVGGGLGV
ncbi:glucose 1-dehydrogenase [Solwaraspora sp. WMMD791]|uniref:glucose 1-dehydrogenase n=1 Tax=Solwaraspora sp. WMMD791 TaxID=3016086 RepID=UPI00249A9434|nr:glucose 1-dehydrogenase [Solwaraspora sp. WMMD791]WFE29887.1 glucose 1-dehydrogenase [Solwaraspora sp. WMMD791]